MAATTLRPPGNGVVVTREADEKQCSLAHLRFSRIRTSRKALEEMRKDKR